MTDDTQQVVSKPQTDIDPEGSNNREDRAFTLHMPDELKAGCFSNNAYVDYNPEQFNIDFFSISRISNCVVARVVSTPQNFKRFTLLCLQQLKKYEEQNGIIGEKKSTEGNGDKPRK